MRSVGSIRKLTEMELGEQEVYLGLTPGKGKEGRKMVGQEGPQSAVRV